MYIIYFQKRNSLLKGLSLTKHRKRKEEAARGNIASQPPAHPGSNHLLALTSMYLGSGAMQTDWEEADHSKHAGSIPFQSASGVLFLPSMHNWRSQLRAHMRLYPEGIAGDSKSLLEQMPRVEAWKESFSLRGTGS